MPKGPADASPVTSWRRDAVTDLVTTVPSSVALVGALCRLCPRARLPRRRCPNAILVRSAPVAVGRMMRLRRAGTTKRSYSCLQSTARVGEGERWLTVPACRGGEMLTCSARPRPYCLNPSTPWVGNGNLCALLCVRTVYAAAR